MLLTWEPGNLPTGEPGNQFTEPNAVAQLRGMLPTGEPGNLPTGEPGNQFPEPKAKVH
ncbi:hypothetical protein [Coleofasciculus sp. E1-EBD-02]|uniref:hypothetical protein n=1 Tax=Coleofasciculus sp. E1-EBD-02 TaxID=3068481 RepID=UPI0033034A08